MRRLILWRPQKITFLRNTSKSSHDVNIMGYHAVHIMAPTSLGLFHERQWLLLWYRPFCFYAALLFCSNMIYFSWLFDSPQNGKTDWWVMMIFSNHGNHAGIDHANALPKNFWSPGVPWCRPKRLITLALVWFFNKKKKRRALREFLCHSKLYSQRPYQVTLSLQALLPPLDAAMLQSWTLPWLPSLAHQVCLPFIFERARYVFVGGPFSSISPFFLPLTSIFTSMYFFNSFYDIKLLKQNIYFNGGEL